MLVNIAKEYLPYPTQIWIIYDLPGLVSARFVCLIGFT
jgi:hypothetical protein